MLIRPTYARVDLGAIKHNVTIIKEHIGNEAAFCAVVKADAYGHGAVMVSKAALEAGAKWLAVAIPEEAAPLREEGIDAPILVLGPASLGQWRKAAELGLSMVVTSMACIDNAHTVARETGRAMKLHIKVDTGMNRVGVRDKEVLSGVLDIIAKEDGLILEGLMSHFAAADEADKSYTQMQHRRFLEFADMVKKHGFSPICHISNSGAAIDCPELAHDMVRVGIAMYGCYPSDEVDKKLKLWPAMSLYTQISHIKTISRGDKVSYGCTFTADEDMRIATLPIGYADGFNRLLSNRGEVLIGGQRARVLGRVCMDQILVDISHIPGVALHDEAVVIGRQGGDEISADDIAAMIGTINYEVLCAISPRVPRLYIEE